jgi:hypothetical protein
MGIEGLFSQAVTIYPLTGSTVSASGEVTKTYAAVGVPARCDIQPARVALRRLVLGEEVAGEYVAFFSAGTVIGELDKVVDGNGVEYTVLFADNIRGHHLEVSLHRGIF